MNNKKQELKKMLAHFTKEELIGWAAFFKMQNDEMDKHRDATQRSQASRTQTR